MKVSFYPNGQIKTFTGDLEEWSVVLSACPTDDVKTIEREQWMPSEVNWIAKDCEEEGFTFFKTKPEWDGSEWLSDELDGFHSGVHEYIEEWCGPPCNPEDSLYRIVDAS